MTISIQVSVNGNYEAPVKVQYQDGTETSEIVSGKGHEGPNVKYIPFYHGSTESVVTVTVGPERYNGNDS